MFSALLISHTLPGSDCVPLSQFSCSARRSELHHTMQVKAHTVALDVQDIQKLERLVPELPPAFQEVHEGSPQLHLGLLRVSMPVPCVQHLDCLCLCTENEHLIMITRAASHQDELVCQVAVLVNNAGLALGKAPAQDNDVADISVMLDTNCKAVAVLTKAVAKGMIARNAVPSFSLLCLSPAILWGQTHSVPRGSLCRPSRKQTAKPCFCLPCPALLQKFCEYQDKGMVCRGMSSISRRLQRLTIMLAVPYTVAPRPLSQRSQTHFGTTL